MEQRNAKRELNTWVCSRVSWFANLAHELVTQQWKSPFKVSRRLTRELHVNLPTNP